LEEGCLEKGRGLEKGWEVKDDRRVREKNKRRGIV
jgi:hypothetical protein